jgi:hypothetical protein
MSGERSKWLRRRSEPAKVKVCLILHDFGYCIGTPIADHLTSPALPYQRQDYITVASRDVTQKEKQEFRDLVQRMKQLAFEAGYTRKRSGVGPGYFNRHRQSMMERLLSTRKTGERRTAQKVSDPLRLLGDRRLVRRSNQILRPFQLSIQIPKRVAEIIFVFGN